MTPPLTPEQLEGIKYDIELWKKWRCEATAFELADHAPLLLAHIESQARRVEEVEKKLSRCLTTLQTIAHSSAAELQQTI